MLLMNTLRMNANRYTVITLIWFHLFQTYFIKFNLQRGGQGGGRQGRREGGKRMRVRERKRKNNYAARICADSTFSKEVGRGCFSFCSIFEFELHNMYVIRVGMKLLLWFQYGFIADIHPAKLLSNFQRLPHISPKRLISFIINI